MMSSRHGGEKVRENTNIEYTSKPSHFSEERVEKTREKDFRKRRNQMRDTMLEEKLEGNLEGKIAIRENKRPEAKTLKNTRKSKKGNLDSKRNKSKNCS